jgi:hypothetical protein
MVWPHLPPGTKRTVSSSNGTRYSLVHHSGSPPASDPTYRLSQNGRRLFSCDDRQELLERLGAVIALRVAETCTMRTFVHAGVIGWGDRAILIPGRSFAGKTTLVAELVRAGATYYSDEFAVVDKRGMVHPYARPLQVRENGSYRQTQRPVEAFGGIAGRKPLRIQLVIVGRYKPEANWRPRQLSPGIGLLKILDNTVSARRSPAMTLSTLKRLVSDAVVVQGVRGEAAQVLDWIAARYGPARPHFDPTE